MRLNLKLLNLNRLLTAIVFIAVFAMGIRYPAQEFFYASTEQPRRKK